MKISIIIPSYNRAALVVKTLDSLLAQTRLPDEILVVDDGSTDNTRDVIAAYSDSHRHIYAQDIIYHYKTNGGLTAARESGLALASGEGILMLDSDDLLCPTALARLEAALDASPAAALAYCRSQTIDENGCITEALWPQEPGEGWVWPTLIQRNFIRSPGAALIRRSHLDRLEPSPVPSEVADWGMWLRLAEAAPFVLVDEPLFQYRVHSTSMSGNVPVMIAAANKMYHVMRKRQRRDAVRRRVVEEARRHFVDTHCDNMLLLAYEDRARGDLAGARSKLRSLLRLRPRHWCDQAVMRFFLGTCKHDMRQRSQASRSGVG